MGDLEALVGDVDRHLDALGEALRARDAAATERHAQQLHHSLARAVEGFSQAARCPGGVALALRQRLALASAKVAAHREALLRATAALDRAIDVLMPRPAAAVYAPQRARFNPAAPGSLR